MALPTPPLLLITDRHQAPRPLVEQVALAVAAGVNWVGVREKDLPKEEQIALVKAIKALPQKPKVVLFGPAGLAMQADADGVHLDRYGAASAARRFLGKDALIGKSCHDEWEVQEAVGADYITLSPLFQSPSKPDAAVMGERRFKELAEFAEMPALALGGMTPEKVPAALVLGAAGIAVMGEIMRNADPGPVVNNLTGPLLG